MNLRPEKKDNVELNITPLIDVVFLLLIFFMVSTTFDRESEINITLPEASEEVTQQQPVAVNVAVDASGQIFINGEPLVNSQLLTIREALRDAAHGLDDPPVIISADEKATHESVVRIMDAARQINLVKITFATRELEE
ncbi:MAG: biopolymer transporter ExbD [Gammaproteobacteria bacterium]